MTEGKRAEVVKQIAILDQKKQQCLMDGIGLYNLSPDEMKHVVFATSRSILLMLESQEAMKDDMDTRIVKLASLAALIGYISLATAFAEMELQ